MQYRKPEIALLGPAEKLILGRKMISIEVLRFEPLVFADSELDD